MNFGVVLVTYNRLDQLKISLQCYEEQGYLPKKVIVVDNASTDGTKEYLKDWSKRKAKFQKIVIFLDENTGGSGGFYEGLKKSLDFDFDYVWVADDDAYPKSDCFEIANDYLKKYSKEKDISAICGTVLNRGNIDTIHRRRIKKGFLWVRQTSISKKEYKMDEFSLDLFSYVGTFINVDKMRKVGVTEKDYFIYYDDTEHSYRLSLAGNIKCIPKMEIVHDGPITNARDGVNWKLYYGVRNTLDFIKRGFEDRYYQFYKYYIRFSYYASVTLFFDHKLEGYKIVNKAIKDAKAGKLGLDDVYKPGWKPNGK